MAANDPPVNVAELLAKVGQSTANIEVHRKAMAELSAAVKAQQPSRNG